MSIHKFDYLLMLKANVLLRILLFYNYDWGMFCVLIQSINKILRRVSNVCVLIQTYPEVVLSEKRRLMILVGQINCLCRGVVLYSTETYSSIFVIFIETPTKMSILN